MARSGTIFGLGVALGSSVVAGSIWAFVRYLIKSNPDARLAWEEWKQAREKPRSSSYAPVVVYVIRHGFAALNKYQDELVLGRSNSSPLEAIGMQQAHLLGMRLRKLGVQFDEVYSSPAVRAHTTAIITCSHLNIPAEAISLRDDLYELSQGSFTTRERKTVYSGKTLKEIEGQKIFFTPPGVAPDDGSPGESQSDVGNRMFNFLSSLLQPNTLPSSAPNSSTPPRTIAIFTHGVAVKCLVRQILGLGGTAAIRMRIENTSITRLTFCPDDTLLGGWVVDCVNDAAHLEGQSL